jgi:hypothetical protein
MMGWVFSLHVVHHSSDALGERPPGAFVRSAFPEEVLSRAPRTMTVRVGANIGLR